jgi:peptidoglycan/xylan/chitin deacetylase (PgdA/CDA1 family)
MAGYGYGYFQGGVSIGSELNVLVAPTLLELTVASDVQINLAWTVNGTAQTGHRIYISTDNITFTEKGTVLGLTATYNATGLTPYTRYYFKVVAYKGGAESESTNIATLRTNAPTILSDGNTVAFYDHAQLEPEPLNNEYGNIVTFPNTVGELYDLLQAVGVQQPIWNEDGISFSGAGHSLQCAEMPFNSPVTFYLYFKQISWTIYDIVLAYDNEVGKNIWQVGTTPRLQAGGTINNTDLSINTWGVLKFCLNGANSWFQINNGTVYTGSITGNMASLTLGSLFAQNSSFSNIKLKDLIVRNIAESVSNNAIVTDYLYKKNAPLNKGKLVITSDDGKSGVYAYGLPLFKAKGVKGTFYLYSNSIDTPGFITSAQALEMYNDGMDMQCHSFTHALFSTLTEDEIITEFTNVNNKFASIGIPTPVHFAYPEAVFNQTTKDYIKTSGLRKTAVVALGGSTVFTDTGTGLYQIPRKVIGNIDEDTLNILKGYMDTAKSKKQALVLCYHNILDSGAGGALDGTISVTQMASIIDYAQSIGIDIVTISELYELLK